MNPAELVIAMRRVEGNLRSTRELTLQNSFCERFTREALDDVYLILRDCDKAIEQQLPSEATVQGSAVVIL